MITGRGAALGLGVAGRALGLLAGAIERLGGGPGADQYKAPAQFREQLLEAMKKKPPAGYDEQVRRYYEELVR